MKRYESRYCTFGVPDDWEPQPPFGFAAPGEEEDRMSAQAIERWLDRPVAAKAWAKKQIKVLPHLVDGFELLAEGSHDLGGSPGEGYFLAYRMLDEDAEPIIAKKVCLTQGPLLADLTVCRPEAGEPRDADLVEGITGTWKFQGTSFLERYRSLELFGSRREAADDEAEEQAERRLFPRCCVSVQVIDGWELAEEDGDAVYRQAGAEIRLHRPVGVETDAEVWRAERMRWAQDTRSFLFGSAGGELENGASYSAVLYEEQGETRRWKTAAVRRVLEVFVEDQQPLLWSLRSPDTLLERHQPVFEELVASAEFLDPREWKTRMAEPWIDLTLQGHWRSEGPGVYFQADDMAILQTNREVSKAPLTDLRPSLVESLRASVDNELEFKEDEQSAKWRGADSLKYSVDGTAATGDPLSLRSIWCSDRGMLYSVVAIGRKPLGVKQSFDPVASAIRFPE